MFLLVFATQAPPQRNSPAAAAPRQDTTHTSSKPASTPAGDSAAVAARIDAYLTASGVRGGVLIAKNNQVVLAAGYGWADAARTVPITPQTVFDIGSITKQFTGTAILKLQEEGKLSVTDPITKYVGEVPADKRNITIHQLLTHTAGFPPDVVERGEVLTRDAALRRILDTKQITPPGAKYHYSNAGFSLLAAIVEIASGEPYEQYLRDKLWKPAGMSKTGFVLPQWNANEIAHGFDVSGDLGTSRDRWGPDGPTWGSRGAGGVLSTLEDLHRWHRALEGEAILSAPSKRALFSAHVPEDDAGTSHYGYGWALFTSPRGTRLIAHDGSNGIFFANFLRYVDDNVVIVYFTNERNSPSRRALGLVADAFFGAPLPKYPAPAAALTAAELANYAGTYHLPSGERFAIDARDHQLSTPAAAWDVTRLLTNFPALAESAPAPATESRIASAADSILRGELEGLRDVLAYEGKFEEEEAYWARTCATWRERFGAFRGSQVVGTLSDKDGRATLVLLRFERGCVPILARLGARERLAVGTANKLLPGDYRFIPQSKTDFLVANDALGTTTRVSFELNAKNEVTGLTIHTGDGPMRASRVDR